MKELYYTEASIAKQSRIFLEKIIPLRNKHVCELNPQELAVLVVDCQNFFFDGDSHAFIPSAQAIVPGIKKLQNYCFQNNISVIHTRHLNNKGNAQMMLKWWGNHLPPADGMQTEIIAELAASQALVINKSQYDAFYNSTLDSILQSKGIKQLIITGVMTHLCCETTARVAFTRGYEVFLGIDTTATYNSQFHLGTLVNLAHGCAMPMLLDEILNKLQGK
jgi:bifunctional isochorismate lyase / aryl carrier protein